MGLAKQMKLEFSSVITDLTESNSSFDHGNLRIAYTGKNRNGSFISKAVFEDAVPSMFGCPVVANYMREMDEIGSHDGELIETDDGQLKYVNITQPVGFVPPGAKYWWETVSDDGVIHQYLNTEVILWKRQEAYEKIKENGITKHSMEITVNDGEMLDDYYMINDFEFTAFCLLGTAEPCFESSALFTFSKTDMQEQFDEMMKEFKLTVSNNSVEKEVNPNVDKLHELLDKYNIKIEDLEFEIENLSDEELEAKFSEAFDNKENKEESSLEDSAEKEKESFALDSQIREALWTVLRQERVEEGEWSYGRYWMVDYDVDAGEVYFDDALNDFNLYGAPYTLEGDEATIDFENAKRKKYVIVDFVEGNSTSASKAIFEALMAEGKAKCSELQNKINAYENAQRKEAAEQLLDKFEEKLGDMAEFKALRSDYGNCSIQELEDKLYALVGRKQFKYAKNTKTPKAPAVPSVERQENVDDPYGSLFNFLKHK